MSNTHQYGQAQDSRSRTHFKQRNFEKNQFQYPPPGFERVKQDANNNSATALLDLLHKQRAPFEQHQGGYKNLSQMPNVTELEMFWRQYNNGQQYVGDYQRLMQQMEYNKNFLAGKSLVEILGVLAQSQLRQQHQQHQPMTAPQNQWPKSHPITKNNQINQMQIARVLERQMHIQAQNPNAVSSGYTPYDPQYWEKIQQQQQAYYQQYEKNMGNRTVKAKFPGRRTRHVQFEDNTKLESFFTPEVVAQASAGQLPVIDTEKAIKVEEFERKIKEVAASCNASNEKK